MADWKDADVSLPPEHQDVLCWDGQKTFVGYIEHEPEDNSVESNWYVSWSMGKPIDNVAYWRELPPTPEFLKASISRIKSVLANVSPEQIGADIGGQVTDYDLRVPTNFQPDGEQHPAFFADKLQKDK